MRIDDDVIRLTSRVQVNETDINTNRQNIADNETDINRLTGEVNDNETDINTNRQNISSQGTTLSRQGRRIRVLENKPPPPPPPPPPVCNPTLGAVTQQMSGKGYPYSSSCGKSCNWGGNSGCPNDGTYKCNPPSNSVQYKTRDGHSLNCVTNTKTFYSSQLCLTNSNVSCN